MYDVCRSHDLLVAGPLSQAVTAALPNWRVFALGDPLPDDAMPVAGIVPAMDSAAGLAATGFAALPVVRIGDDVGSLPYELADLLADRLQEAQRDAADARRAAALLRRECEEQMRRLRMLENFAHALGGPRHVQALQWAPTSFSLELSEAVTQRFPVDTLSLAAIDLWLPDAEPEDAAATAIELLDATGGTVARLSAEGTARRSGGAWVRFSTPEPITGPARDTVARIVPPDGRSIAIGLTSPVPDPRFAVQMDGGSAAEATIAGRIWRADYMATLPAPNTDSKGSVSAGSQQVRRISMREMDAPELLAVPPTARDYVATQYWARENAVLVHPSTEGPVCAILRGVEVAAVTAISALVNVGHRDAPVLGFAVGVCPRGVATADNWHDHIGPYVFLPAGAWGECHHIPQVEPRTRCDVLLSTMVAGNVPNDQAWALFHGLRVTSDSS